MTAIPLHERPEAVRDALASACISPNWNTACQWPRCGCTEYPPAVRKVITALEPHVSAMIAEAVTEERERCARTVEACARDVRDEIENERTSVPMDCALTWLETAAIAIRKGAKS